MRFLIDRNDTCDLNDDNSTEINLNLILLIINLNLLVWFLILVSCYKNNLKKFINYIKGTNTEPTESKSYLEFINIV